MSLFVIALVPVIQLNDSDSEYEDGSERMSIVEDVTDGSENESLPDLDPDQLNDIGKSQRVVVILSIG